MTTRRITQHELDASSEKDRRWKYPGVTGPGIYAWNEAQNRYEPVLAEENPHDFSYSGLGIGGAGRHDLIAEIDELVARGEMEIRERPRRGPMPHGQLWESCPRCGQEPVCLDCGLCRRHCKC